jgi:hypothetical protein
VRHLDLRIAKPDGSEPIVQNGRDYAIDVRLVAIAAFRCS